LTQHRPTLAPWITLDGARYGSLGIPGMGPVWGSRTSAPDGSTVHFCAPAVASGIKLVHETMYFVPSRFA
jgi:hypothetical protein